MVIDGLQRQIPHETVGPYLIRPKKEYKDPVIDPRETWGNWARRVSEFKAAPLVEREDLPFDLQPQNRKMGRFHHFLDRIVSSGSKIKPSLQPNETKSEIIEV